MCFFNMLSKYDIIFFCLVTILLQWPKLILSDCELLNRDKFKLFDCEGDHLQLLKSKGYMVAVGGMNTLYKINMTSFDYEQTLWYDNASDSKMCLAKWKSEDLCKNYMRIYEDFSDDHFLLCGTNSFQPICRVYKNINGYFKVVDEYPATGLCPRRPCSNSTAVVVDGKIFAATYDDYNDHDPLICRDPVRTINKNTYQLDEPNFVGSFRHEKYVYFFFREMALDPDDGQTYVNSKVARVCINDNGYGDFDGKKRWISFFKSRLLCANGSNYFDQIQAVSDVAMESYEGNDQLFYAVFHSVPPPFGKNPFRSAVCAFSMKDVKESFNGFFKGGSAYPENSPYPRPGSCANYSTGVPSEIKNFVETHYMMDKAINSFFEEPIIQSKLHDCRFISIYVDPQVETINKKSYDIIYIGTECGLLLKVINNKRNKNIPTIINMQHFVPVNIIKSIYIYKKKALLLSETVVTSRTIHRCEKRATNCKRCVSLRDPFCAWNKKTQICTTIISKKWTSDDLTYFVQDVENANELNCPPPTTTTTSDCPTQKPNGAVQLNSKISLVILIVIIDYFIL